MAARPEECCPTGEAESYYRDLKERHVRVGLEATGHSRWFERLLVELNYELWIGDLAQIRAKRVRKQKNASWLRGRMWCTSRVSLDPQF